MHCTGQESKSAVDGDGDDDDDDDDGGGVGVGGGSGGNVRDARELVTR